MLIKSALCVLAFSFFFTAKTNAQSSLKLWYTHPAKNWYGAMPIGNGRMAAMDYGGVSNDTLQLNEATVWAGGPNNNVNPSVKKVLPELRKLIFGGKYLEAQKLANAKVTPKGNSGMPYQPVGNLVLTFPNQGHYSDYCRDLNLKNAVSSVRYNVNGVTYHRETFASIPDQVIVIRLWANKPGSITCKLGMDSPQMHSVEVRNKELFLRGISGSHENMEGQVRFETIVKPVVKGGSVQSHGKSIDIENADEVTLYVSIGTNFKKYDNLSGHQGEIAESYLSSVSGKSYEQILQDHTAAYQKYFDRVQLNLGNGPAENVPTDVRLKQFAHGNDPQLAALYFQFGRYLLISSSEPGGQPPNLQGIWNDSMHPPWDSKYTDNINLEMNYWPAEMTDLPEMEGPFIQMVKELSVTGQQGAREMYGARGWVLHHNTDLWRITGVVDNAFYGFWPEGGTWLCENLWRHYMYTGDESYLREIYPILKGASEFFVDELQVEPTHHWLVVCPSMSPEHKYMKKDGVDVSITDGATMDNQLVFDLFSHTIKAAQLLDKDPLFADTLRMKRDSLPPMQIGKYSQLQEWIKDWDNPNDHHRHVSHLYGLFPSDQISPYRTPKLFEAARTSLIYRGDEATGWSSAWKTNLWARLLNGDHAYKLLKKQLTVTSDTAYTLPNLFDSIYPNKPVFQIDANFGFTSGIAEMLLQSYDGDIFVLPALPDEWKSGSEKGLVARGGFIVDEKWENGRLKKLVIHSRLGGNCRIRSFMPLKSVNQDVHLAKASGNNPNPFYQTPDIKQPLISSKAKLKKLKLRRTWLYDFPTKEGGTYTFTAAK